MKGIGFDLVLAWLVLIAGCGDLPVAGSELLGPPKQFLSRQIIVALSEDVRDQWQAINEEILDRFDVQPAGAFPLTSIRVNCLVYRVSDMVEADEIMRRLRVDKRIALVQSNQVFTSLETGGDKGYGALSYGPKMIRADVAHSAATGKGVSVAVIDTGADQEHVDLKGRVAAAENFVEGGDAEFAEDRHGTAVAGVIAARAGDGGIDGVAPDARVDVYKACWYADKNTDKALCSSWTLAKALDAAIKSGGRVINLSLGGPEDALLKKLLIAANQRHIVLVAAALENHPEPGFPASLDFVIPVISSDPHGDTARPGWTSTQEVIAAPGVEVLTTTPHDSYDFLSGSSLAAAHVSGVVALLLQQQPKLKPATVRDVLRRTGKPSVSQHAENNQAFRLVDACRALAALGAAVACP